MTQTLTIHRTTLFAAAALTACTAPAPKPPAGAPAELRGALIESPVSAETAPTPAQRPPEIVTVYATAEAVAGQVVGRDAIEHEWGNDAADLEPVIYISYGQSGARHKVRMGESFVWMEKPAGSTFKTPDDFYMNILAYMQAWDGVFYDAPGGQARRSPAVDKIPVQAWAKNPSSQPKEVRDKLAKLAPGWQPRDAPLKVLKVRVVDGEIWLEIAVLDIDLCESESASDAVVYDHGWVRQRAAAPLAVVTYSPRGC